MERVINSDFCKELGDLNTGRDTYQGGIGHATAALIGGGKTGAGRVACSEEWNGNVWSATNVINTARNESGAGGTVNAGILFGGSTPSDGDETEKMILQAYERGGPSFISLKSDPKLTRSIMGTK